MTAKTQLSAQPSVLITGAASGIGLETARQLAQSGFKVYATDRNGPKMAKQAEILQRQGGTICPFYLDVTDQISIAAVLAEIEAKAGGLDVLINNAGYALLGPVEEISDQEAHRQFEVNFFGSLNMIRATLPLLRARRGRIIQLSSMMGRVSTPGWGIYSASKYALEGLSEALRMELSPWGIRIILIEPGSVLTNFTDTARAALPEKFRGPDTLYPGLRPSLENYTDFTANVTPAAVARIIVKASETRWPKARYMIDYSSRRDVWLYQLLPTFLTDWAVKRRVKYGKKSVKR